MLVLAHDVQPFARLHRIGAGKAADQADRLIDQPDGAVSAACSCLVSATAWDRVCALCPATATRLGLKNSSVRTCAGSVPATIGGTGAADDESWRPGGEDRPVVQRFENLLWQHRGDPAGQRRVRRSGQGTQMAESRSVPRPAQKTRFVDQVRAGANREGQHHVPDPEAR